MDSSALPSARPVNRPGCISAYAILLWLGGALYILGALCIGGMGLTETSNLARSVGEAGGSSATIALLIGAVCLGLLGVVPIVTGVGLWQMRDWAWWLVVVLQSLGLALTAVSLCLNLVALGMPSGGQSASETTTTVVTNLISVLVSAIVNGGILYWFLKNHDLFRGGVGAQPGEKANAGTVVAIVLALVGIFVMVPIVVIIILALLGPAIANVFSNIMVTI